VPISASTFIKGMRGGAQSKLLRASNGHSYVVKFQNNPQGKRILANELLAGQLARKVGLPVPEPRIIWVSEELIDATPQLRIEHPANSTPCVSGFQFGSKFVLKELGQGEVRECTSQLLSRGMELGTVFAGMLAFDIWTLNRDYRQVLTFRHYQEQNYSVAFIDNGHCFNATKWSFADTSRFCMLHDCLACSWVTGWNSFEPWLSRIEALDEEQIWRTAADIPEEWYESKEDLVNLVCNLAKRRRQIRRELTSMRRHTRNPFPHWGDRRLAARIGHIASKGHSQRFLELGRASLA